MTKREEIARTIDPAAFAMGGSPEWALRKADAVLDVLAEPDEGMIEAGWQVIGVGERCDTSHDIAQAYTAMLQAARSPALVVPHVEEK